MLAELARFGYANALYSVLAVARSAVLAGASRIVLRGLTKGGLTLKTFDGLEIEFDGEPFDEEFLRHPYDCLFGSSSDRPRRAQMARALLSIARSGPNRLTLTSGAPGARFELSVRQGEEELRPLEGKGFTVLRVEWEGYFLSTSEMLFGLVDLIEEKMRHSPIPVTLENVWTGYGDSKARGDFAMRPPEAAPVIERVLRQKGMRGVVGVPLRIVPNTAHVDLCWAGVTVERFSDASFLHVPVDGFIDFDRFSLDISAGAVVRDDAYKTAVAALNHEATALAIRAAREQAEAMKASAALLQTARNREMWTGTLDGSFETMGAPTGWGAPTYTAKEQDERAKIHLVAARTRWLRYCAKRVLDSGEGAPELIAALKEAPLFFSTGLEPLSLTRLAAILESAGRIPASANFGSGLGPILWLSSSRDAALLPERYTIKRQQ